MDCAACDAILERIGIAIPSIGSLGFEWREQILCPCCCMPPHSSNDLTTGEGGRKWRDRKGSDIRLISSYGEDGRGIVFDRWIYEGQHPRVYRKADFLIRRLYRRPQALWYPSKHAPFHNTVSPRSCSNAGLRNSSNYLELSPGPRRYEPSMRLLPRGSRGGHQRHPGCRRHHCEESTAGTEAFRRAGVLFCSKVCPRPFMQCSLDTHLKTLTNAFSVAPTRTLGVMLRPALRVHRIMRAGPSMWASVVQSTVSESPMCLVTLF